MRKKLGILLYKDVQPMDVIGPWEVFSFWQQILHAPLDMYLVAETAGFIECDNNIVLKAHTDFQQAPQFDYFIVPGGRGRNNEINNEKLITFVQAQAKHCDYLLSVCTGMFLLLKAQLLVGKPMTTYWRALPELQALPNISIIEDRIVKEGHIWLSGGVTSGIDLALELIAEVAGTETAGQVQLLCEYFPRDVVYCTEQTAQSLPAYPTAKKSQTYLPAYIKKYLVEKNK